MFNSFFNKFNPLIKSVNEFNNLFFRINPINFLADTLASIFSMHTSTSSSINFSEENPNSESNGSFIYRGERA